MLVFDTSAYINGWRHHYRPGNFPSVWEAFGAALEDGRIVAPRMVLTELEEKDDDVFAWANRHRDRFIDPGEAAQAEIGPIQDLVQKSPVRDRADPFVIAEAKVRNFTVVTYEGTNTFTGQRTKKWASKMPGICEQLGVRCVIPPDTFDALGIRL